MIDMGEVNRAIDELENGDTTFHSCEKLATLYSVRDHMNGNLRYTPENRYSFAAAPKSEFLQACEGVPTQPLLEIIDAHLESVKMVYPKEYNYVLLNILNLR